jgi:hypothetical protein
MAAAVVLIVRLEVGRPLLVEGMKPEAQLMPIAMFSKKDGCASSAASSLRTESIRDLLSFTRDRSPRGLVSQAPSYTCTASRSSCSGMGSQWLLP